MSAIGLTLAIALILLASNFTTINAQAPPQQQVQSDGGLTATLNGSSFTRGDTITFSGTVAEREIDSFVVIEVVDPNSQIVENGYPTVTADNTFTYSFEAGVNEQGDTTPMEQSGNYRAIVRYQQPGVEASSEDFFAEVELIFAYTTAPQPTPEAAITASPSPPIDSRITTPSTAAATTFQSTNDSFRTLVPGGWRILDLNNTGSMLSQELRQGYGILAQLCPEEEQPSQQGGAASNTTTSNNSCQGVQEEVAHVIRYPDLNTRIPAANNVTTTNNTNMTIENVLSYSLQKLQEVGYRNIQIVNTTDMRVNITSPQTNQTIAAAPAELVEMTYSTGIASNELRRSYFILTATDRTPPDVGTIKGYSIFYEDNASNSSAAISEITTTSASSTLSPQPLPPAAAQIFHSFELIAAPELAPPPPAQPAGGGQTQGGATMGGDLNCEDITERNFAIDPNNDPNGFDGDNDGIGCETGASVGEDDDSDGGDSSCHPSYPDTCIPPPPPNLNCDDVDETNFEVVGSDPHGFDRDNDGIGCESGSGGGVPDDSDGGDDDGGGGEDPDPEPEPEPGDGGGEGGEGGGDDGGAGEDDGA